MFILGAIALIAGGLALGAAVLTKYWESIRYWLNNTAADVVEEVLGYEARRMMFKAISVADKVIRWIKGRRVAINISTVYTKQSEGTYSKTVMSNEIPASELDPNYENEMKNSTGMMELDYK